MLFGNMADDTEQSSIVEFETNVDVAGRDVDSAELSSSSLPTVEPVVENGETPQSADLSSPDTQVADNDMEENKRVQKSPPLPTYELQQGYRILKEIMSDQNKSVNWPFLDPIDTEELGDYTEKIKQPMWLKKMKDKFFGEEYETITQLVGDIRLMVENCYRYNGPDHVVSKRGQKLEIVLEQKLALLSRELREKTSIEATSGKPSAEPEGYRRRSGRSLAPHSSSALLNQLRLEEREREKELRRQHILERRKEQEAYLLELQEWEEGVYADQREYIKAMWELPQIGHFLFVANQALNLGEVVQHELELSFLLPRETSVMSRLMTSLLSTPYQRTRLNQKPPMPYKVWEDRLRSRLNVWYKHLNMDRTNLQEAADKIGLDVEFFHICGLKNPMRKRKFHDLTVYQRVWIVKGLCDSCLHNQESVREAIEAQPIEEQHAYLLGTDDARNSYLHFPQFCGADLRIYRQGPLPIPSLKTPKKQHHTPVKRSVESSRSPSPVKHSSKLVKSLGRSEPVEVIAPPRKRPGRLRQQLKTVLKQSTPATSSDESYDVDSVSSSFTKDVDYHSEMSSNASLPTRASQRLMKNSEKTKPVRKSSRVKKNDDSHIESSTGDCEKRTSVKESVENDCHDVMCSQVDEDAHGRGTVVLNEQDNSGYVAMDTVAGRNRQELLMKGCDSPGLSEKELANDVEKFEFDSKFQSTDLKTGVGSGLPDTTEGNDIRFCELPNSKPFTSLKAIKAESECVVTPSSSTCSLVQMDATSMNEKMDTDSESLQMDIDKRSESLDTDVQMDSISQQSDTMDMEYVGCKLTTGESMDCDPMSNGVAGSNVLSMTPVADKQSKHSSDGAVVKLNVEREGSEEDGMMEQDGGSQVLDSGVTEVCGSVDGKAARENVATGEEESSQQDARDTLCANNLRRCVANENAYESLLGVGGVMDLSAFDLAGQIDGEDLDQQRENGPGSHDNIENSSTSTIQYGNQDYQELDEMVGSGNVPPEEESEDEEVEEIFPEIGPFELVVTTVEDLRSLTAKFAEQEPTIVGKGKKQKIIPPPARKRCVQDLHKRLAFLLSELEPWESKLIQANKKTKEKIRKEVDDWVEEELEKETENVWDSDEPVTTESESSETEEESPNESGVELAQNLEKKKTSKQRKLGEDESVTANLDEEELTDISMRGRIRKRRVIPNNVEDQGLKKKPKKAEDIPATSATIVTDKNSGLLSHLNTGPHGNIPGLLMGQNIYKSRTNHENVIRALLARPMKKFAPYPSGGSSSQACPSPNPSSSLAQCNQALTQLIMGKSGSATATSVVGSTSQRVQYVNYANLNTLPPAILQQLIKNQSSQVRPVTSIPLPSSSSHVTLSKVQSLIPRSLATAFNLTTVPTQHPSVPTSVPSSAIQLVSLSTSTMTTTVNAQYANNSTAATVAPRLLQLTPDQLSNPAVLQQLVAAGLVKISPQHPSTLLLNSPHPTETRTVQQVLLKTPVKSKYANNMTVKSLLETKAAKSQENKVKTDVVTQPLVLPAKTCNSSSLQQGAVIANLGMAPIQVTSGDVPSFVKSTVIDSALKSVVTETVKTSLPTVSISVPSPLTLPTVQPRRSVTHCTSAMKSPIPAAVQLQASINSGQPITTTLATSHSHSMAITNTAFQPMSGPTVGIPPKTSPSKDTNKTLAPQKNVIVRLVSPAGAGQQGVLMLPRNLVVSPGALQQNPAIQALLSQVQQQQKVVVTSSLSVPAQPSTAAISAFISQPTNPLSSDVATSHPRTLSPGQARPTVTGPSSVSPVNVIPASAVQRAVLNHEQYSSLQQSTPDKVFKVSHLTKQSHAQGSLVALGSKVKQQNHLAVNSKPVGNNPLLQAQVGITGMSMPPVVGIRHQKQAGVIPTQGLVSSRPRVATSIAPSLPVTTSNFSAPLTSTLPSILSTSATLVSTSSSAITSQTSIIPAIPGIHLQGVPTSHASPVGQDSVDPKGGATGHQPLLLFKIGGQLVTADGSPVILNGGQLRVVSSTSAASVKHQMSTQVSASKLQLQASSIHSKAHVSMTENVTGQKPAVNLALPPSIQTPLGQVISPGKPVQLSAEHVLSQSVQPMLTSSSLQANPSQPSLTVDQSGHHTTSRPLQFVPAPTMGITLKAEGNSTAAQKLTINPSQTIQLNALNTVAGVPAQNVRHVVLTEPRLQGLVKVVQPLQLVQTSQLLPFVKGHSVQQGQSVQQQSQKVQVNSSEVENKDCFQN